MTSCERICNANKWVITECRTNVLSFSCPTGYLVRKQKTKNCPLTMLDCSCSLLAGLCKQAYYLTGMLGSQLLVVTSVTVVRGLGRVQETYCRLLCRFLLLGLLRRLLLLLLLRLLWLLLGLLIYTKMTHNRLPCYHMAAMGCLTQQQQLCQILCNFKNVHGTEHS